VVDIDSEYGVLLSFMYEVDEPSEEFKELVAKMLDRFFEKRVLS